jgi:hypothetical protein
VADRPQHRGLHRVRAAERLGLARLAPGATYQVRGASGGSVVANAQGEASLDVELRGRTALEIVRA